MDNETFQVEDQLDELEWMDLEQSSDKIEMAMNKSQVGNGQKYRDSGKSEPRFIIHPKLSNPIPHSESFL